MDIFSLFTLCGGLAFFLYGMSVMSTGLEKMAGGKLEQLLKKMTDSPWRGLLLGAGITAAIQSSSAVTVMLVGLVNSGIMDLARSIPVIMGSNVGTTMTAWILSLAGIESKNFWVSLLKPEAFSPVLALAGIVLLMGSKENRRRSVGNILIGFAVLMYGMELMKGAVEPLAEVPEFTRLLTAFANPLLGVLAGALITAAIQSSSASVGILQALSLTGSVTFSAALPIIMGQNIGTCVTALLSSVGVNKDARRVSVVHVAFNLTGTAVFLTLFYSLDALFRFPFTARAVGPVDIAVIHSIFNLCTTALLFPFCRWLEKLASVVVRDGKQKERYAFVDARLLATPSVAIAECGSKTVEMSRLARDTILKALSLLDHYDEKVAEEVKRSEDRLDFYEDKLGTLLVRLSSKALSDADSRQVSKQLHTIGDFERIGDHAVNLWKAAEEIYEKRLKFCGPVLRELNTLIDALREILDLTVQAFAQDDLAMAEEVEPLEQVIDCLIADIKTNHVARLKSGQCTIEMGFILSDVLTNCERVSDHCSNIAVAQIETEQNAYEAHEYLNGVKNAGNAAFQAAFDRYRAQYSLI